jgi:hypothetical protein
MSTLLEERKNQIGRVGNTHEVIACEKASRQVQSVKEPAFFAVQGWYFTP